MKSITLLRGSHLLAATAAMAIFVGITLPSAALGQQSKPIAEVLRQPLPPEDLTLHAGESQMVITGPTFTYTVNRNTGAISGLEVRRDGKTILRLQEADFAIDDYHLSRANSGATQVTAKGTDRIVLKTDAQLPAPAAGRPSIAYTLTNTFFNDGVVVAELELVPAADVTITREIGHRLLVDGPLQQYLHKTRGSIFPDKVDRLPKPGDSLAMGGLTSCLQVFSHDAALAMFTDVGATHCSGKASKSASIESLPADGNSARVRLCQQIVDVGEGGDTYRLKAAEPFRLRFGISVAPNRLPHPRRHDLRMFIWVGDAKHPYPTSAEIRQAAQLGFTLFQMHRLGTPGLPRPPAGELQRVIKEVHQAGMLFLWTANADLMYASAPGVADLVARDKWVLWQGFNYGGRYQAAMDPYCNTLATCLASPNGLADYRVETLQAMMKKFQVDGMYIDDNLAYGNCTLWKEHNHPRPVYDCLIELHEINWRRRQAIREHCPHAVLVDHCSKGVVLPDICDFDVHLFGEGYSFPSVSAYWDLVASVQNMDAQGSLFAGDSETVRCSAALAYNFDLLTGGGQYTYLDWRLWPAKFPYASGVRKEEHLFVRHDNLAQYYFGLYESTPNYFADAEGRFSTSAPDTFATVYRNDTWGDCLIPLANMAKEPRATRLAISNLGVLGLSADARYALFDVNARTSRVVSGKQLAEGIDPVTLPAQGLRLFCLRQLPTGTAVHLWGGKRISERRDPASGDLTVQLLAPAGVNDTVVFAVQGKTVRQVRVAGKPAEFFHDPTTGLVHGELVFDAAPVSLELSLSDIAKDSLPAKPLAGDELAQYLKIGD